MGNNYQEKLTEFKQSFPDYYTFIIDRAKTHITSLETLSRIFSAQEKSLLINHILISVATILKKDGMKREFIEGMRSVFADYNNKGFDVILDDTEIKVMLFTADFIKPLLFFDNPNQIEEVELLLIKIRSGIDANIVNAIKKDILDKINSIRKLPPYSKKQRGYKKKIGNEIKPIYNKYKAIITKTQFSNIALPIIKDGLNIPKEDWSTKKFLDVI